MRFMKQTEKQKRLLYWFMFIFISSFVIAFIFLGAKQALLMTGIKIEPSHVYVLIFISVCIWGSFMMLKLLKYKVTTYFIIAFILSWIVLFIGFSLYSNMYKTELPFSLNPNPYDREVLNNITDNGTNPNIFPYFVCSSLQKRSYFSEWDNYGCKLPINLTKGYTLSRIYVDRRLKNMSSESYTLYCSNYNETCNFQILTYDNSFGFSIIPTYIEQDSSIQPIFYYFEIQKLRDWKDLDNLEQNKTTLLIAIITASLLTVWAGVYYAKKILEEN